MQALSLLSLIHFVYGLTVHQHFPRKNFGGSSFRISQMPSSTHLQASIVETTNDNQEIKLTWEVNIKAKILEQLNQDNNPNPSRPYMVAVVGIPGSGKSTSCSILSDLLRNVGCFLMPFDGYHFSLKELKEFSNPDDAIYRRGAPFTFNVEALKRDLQRIRFGSEQVVKLPGFDHARGDPEEDAHTFERAKHNALLCEGLYLLHDDDDWKDVADYFDLTIFVNADIDVCIDRLKERNKCIPGYSPEEIEIRCDAVDRVNALTVVASKERANLVVESAATANA